MEDLTVLGGIWMIFNHPVVMLVLVLGFLVLVVWLVPKLFRLAKLGFQALRNRLRGAKPGETALGGPSPSSQ
jgi:hypothetical protein